MNDILEIKESLIKHIRKDKSRKELNFDECFDCAYRPVGKKTCENINSLLEDALNLIKSLEPRVLGVNEIVEGDGYWLTVMDNNFVNRPVICIHKEDDAKKKYITLAWQFGTFSWETETYGTEWRLWSSKPIGREW